MLPGHNLEALQNIRLNGGRQTDVEEEREEGDKEAGKRAGTRRDTKRREHRKISRGSRWSEEGQKKVKIKKERERKKQV